MLRYEPGETVAHGLDPRAKLCFQGGFAIAALAATGTTWLVAVYAVAGLALLGARLSPVRVVRTYRVVFVILALAPVLAGLALGPPWLRVEPALASLFAVARIPPVVAVSAAYIRTTPVRETRTAVQRLVPGRLGTALGIGVSLVFRFFPLLVDDLRTIQAAIRARGGERRSVRERARMMVVRGLDRTLARADRLTLALRARCFAWNPTLPALRFRRRDYVVTALGAGLACLPLVSAPGRFIPVG